MVVETEEDKNAVWGRGLRDIDANIDIFTDEEFRELFGEEPDAHDFLLY